MMADESAFNQQSTKRRTKVKTGCATCRIRKVKCGEEKPSCQKCVNTGRTCDGYESTFRNITCKSINSAHAPGTKSVVGIQPTRTTFVEIAPQDVDLLNRYFSVKTMLDVDLDCDEEARQILQASLTDPPIQHAVSSLKALREDLETYGDGPTVVQQTPSHHYGLQQYSMALRGLASNLALPDSKGLKSALLCCQIFISIEQVRNSYTAMAQHIIQGLRIMHEYRARPHLATNGLVPANHDRLPLLDVFIIKLFAAPCKFTESPAATESSASVSSGSLTGPHCQPVENRDLRTIAPNMRTELTRISTSTLEFLDKVSQVDSVKTAIQLLPNKMALLDSLQSWLNDQGKIESSGPELIMNSFLHFFHQILKIVLLWSLNSSPDLYAELLTAHDRLKEIANNVEERVKAYAMVAGVSGGRREHSTAR